MRNVIVISLATIAHCAIGAGDLKGQRNRTGWEPLISYYQGKSDNHTVRGMDNKLKLAFANLRAGRLSDAERLLNQYQKMQKQNVEIKHGLAEVYLATKRYEKARVILLKIVKEAPNDLVATYNLGLAQFLLRDFGAAKNLFTKALDLDEKCVPAILGRAQTRLLLNDLSGAAEDFSRAFELDPRNGQALLLSARSLIHSNPEEAKRLFEQFVSLAQKKRIEFTEENMSLAKMSLNSIRAERQR